MLEEKKEEEEPRVPTSGNKNVDCLFSILADPVISCTVLSDCGLRKKKKKTKRSC